MTKTMTAKAGAFRGRAASAWLLLLLLGPSCSSSDAPAAIPRSPGCQLQSDCDEGLLCTAGICHLGCKQTSDCNGAERCVVATTGAVCQLIGEEKCSFKSDCLAPLVCGPDEKCRNECAEDQGDRDCLKGQICAKGGFCAEPAEVSGSANSLPETRDANGGAGGMSTGPANDAGGPPATGAGGTGGGRAGSGGGASVGGASDGGAPPVIPCDVDNQCRALLGSGHLCVDSACAEGDCRSTNECVKGELCGDTKAHFCGACQSDEACVGEERYGTGYRCIDGQCLEGDCASSADCAEGQICGALERYRCGGCGADQACQADAYYGAKYICSGSTDLCEPGDCRTDGDCAGGTLCGSIDENTCGACDDDTQCLASGAYGAGFLCVDGACLRATCHDDEACTPGRTCSPIAHACQLRFSSVSLGNDHICALAAEDTLWCWGANGAGQLGNASNMGGINPAPLLVENVAATRVSAGQGQTCAVKTNSTVACWGDGSYGQTSGAIGSSGPVPLVPIQGVATDVLAGAEFSCARFDDQSLACWGSFPGGGGPGPTPIALAQVTDVATAYVGHPHSMCAVKANDTVWCWGDNRDGQLGDGTTVAHAAPTQVVGPNASISFFTGAAEVKLGAQHACARKAADQSVWCWGDNSSGQLGDGTTTAHTVPVRVKGLDGSGFLKASAIGLGRAHSCALLPDATVACWGANNLGQLGNSTTATSLVPAQVPILAGVSYLNSAYDAVCTIKAVDGSLWCWGYGYWVGFTSNSPVRQGL
jgi:alpha-tubulin suppressor-like RCC1 family protein